MRPLGCSMIEDTAGSLRNEAVAASDEAGTVASRTRTPADARSAARKADTGPSPRAVAKIGASEAGARPGEPAPAWSRGVRAAALSAA